MIRWNKLSLPHPRTDTAMYQVLERFIQGKQDARHCEDGIVLSHGFAAVIDGSTSKGNYDWGNETSGQLARDILSTTLPELSPDANAMEVCSRLTEAINGFTKRATGKDAAELSACNRLTAVMAIYNDRKKEVWQIGDCPCLIDGILHENGKPQETILAKRRAGILEKALKEGADIEMLESNDIGRKGIINDLKALCNLQNKAFAVLDGTPVDRKGVCITDVSKATTVVLATDGYPLLLPTLQDSEQALQKQLEADPLCIGSFQATKGLRPGYRSFDDRAYVKIRLQP